MLKILNTKSYIGRFSLLALFVLLTVNCSEEPSSEVLSGKWVKDIGMGAIHFTKSGEGWAGYVSLPLSEEVGRGLKAVEIKKKIKPRRYDYNYTTRYAVDYATGSSGMYLFRDEEYRPAELVHHEPSDEFLKLIGGDKEESFQLVGRGNTDYGTFSRVSLPFNLWLKFWNFIMAIFSSVVIIMCAPFIIMALAKGYMMMNKVEGMANERHRHNAKLAVKLGVVDRAEKSSTEKTLETLYPLFMAIGVFSLFFLGSWFGISDWWSFLEYYF